MGSSAGAEMLPHAEHAVDIGLPSMTQRQLGAALRAKLHVVTTIIIEGEEAYATGCARLGQILRYPFAGLLQRSQCWRHKEKERAKDALARRCVVGCAHGKGRVRVCYVLLFRKLNFRRNRQWGAAPFTLAPSFEFSDVTLTPF